MLVAVVIVLLILIAGAWYYHATKGSPGGSGLGAPPPPPCAAPVPLYDLIQPPAGGCSAGGGVGLLTAPDGRSIVPETCDNGVLQLVEPDSADPAQQWFFSFITPAGSGPITGDWVNVACQKSPNWVQSGSGPTSSLQLGAADCSPPSGDPCQNSCGGIIDDFTIDTASQLYGYGTPAPYAGLSADGNTLVPTTLANAVEFQVRECPSA